MPHHPAHSSSHPQSPPQATTTAPASAIPSSIPDTRLGLSPQDVATLRQHQQLAHAQARSPAGSQASSQGRLLLDPGSLQMLAQHFDRVMQAIAQRLEQLNRATESATQTQYDRAGHAIQMADAEIARFRAILHQIDELETEFEKIQRIREIVRGFRARVEHLDRRLG
ncbi:hypothetical protein KC318_g9310 [Hortaea werneckii]|uniref:Biogenesis of lysosome-related organelles complex 1 subunit CNL1 n=1 Tax=Hortaea werneckii TaxID=91943 RepID=A0A3M6YDV5_HORWE|nr:hypothetical protein KC334_g9339 [Hortaea werneckii]KAI7661661.1 hypothetical protein KC318_g9310 [Hortaea werneckii]RMY01238.1 hypothetical protein D0867_11456 [Hortaea werneckii]RMY22692.1 hypothetical protein D0866_11872 [Hortaea werneckii]